jgi:Permuted papain-like amidase enzyme, YaeF/YiiX, C92 family
MLKITLSLLLALVSLSSHALELKVGDVLLKPMDCWSCSLIEAEEETIYSHMGIVIATKPSVIVAEALGNVRKVSLEAFLATTEKDQKISVRRLNNEKAVSYISAHQDILLSLFKNDFESLSYDHEFRWNNLDENGKEKLYCSEFVGKFLFAFMGIEAPIKRMHFTQNRDQWEKYFHGNVPDNQWGNSPGDFERSEYFHPVGDL